MVLFFFGSGPQFPADVRYPWPLCYHSEATTTAAAAAAATAATASDAESAIICLQPAISAPG